MNCPSRVDEPEGTGYNQNPNALAADLTTREDLNGIANERELKRSCSEEVREMADGDVRNVEGIGDEEGEAGLGDGEEKGAEFEGSFQELQNAGVEDDGGGGWKRTARAYAHKFWKVFAKFTKFIGPGFMISVAYIDPGNYSTDVAAGATFKYKLLFIVLMSNIFAIFLQSLCIRLGSVSGLNLAEACREFLPRWLNYFLYFMAEAAIIATDIAEVIGTAIALNLLIPEIPLVAGCAISIVDVLLILLFYRPDGGMKGLRAFEIFVMSLVLGVVVCFCIQLSLIKDTSAGEVFKGYLPSSAIVTSNGLYSACGILGATVMPHSLYLGSGIVQPRLHEYDAKHDLLSTPVQPSNTSTSSHSTKEFYHPSLAAINHCLKYSIIELALALFTFALFVNSAILIVSGASLSESAAAADGSLFDIYHLLSSTLSKAAGTIFALALLLSGISAGIVCTIAGQMVSEGAINWKLQPWMRRLITRSISITPSIVIAGAVGGSGLSKALVGTQVALSVVLPFVAAPVVWFTARGRFMTVRTTRQVNVLDGDGGLGEMTVDVHDQGVNMRNHWLVTVFAVLIWLVITTMNIANLVLLGKGQGE